MLLCGGMIGIAAPQAHAELIVGVSLFGELVTFDSAAPSIIINRRAISGLTGQAQGEAISAIDYRPANGKLYALGNAPGSLYRLYTLDISTGVATRVGATDYTTFSGTFFGFDFNPQVDRIRVVSDGETNVRLNPNDGTLAGTDTAITPAGDLVAVAYDRNDNVNTTLTTLYGIDATSDSLVRVGGLDGIPSPNDGAVTTVGPLGVNTTGRVSFDISSNTGLAYAALTFNGTEGQVSSLYTVNLLTGTASLIGPIGDGSEALRALSVQVIPEPSSVGLLVVAGGMLVARRRRGLRED